ncbi:MAG TPA: type II secretion system protein GspE, partial [Armatimonadetes bacterium]|nr:type II secretion system protein GspE [Armatimonadota bacterium]
MTEYLMQKGYLKQEQLEEASKVQAQTGKDISIILRDLGMVGEREIMEARAQEQGHLFVDLDRFSIESSAVNIVPERLVKLHNAIPVKKDGMTLWVAMENPNNLEAIDQIQLASGCRVRPAIALPAAIEDAIRKNYASSSGVATSDDGGSTTNGAGAAGTSATGNVGGRADFRALMAQAQVQRDTDKAATNESEGDEDMADQAPIIKLANALIQQGINDRASDIHVEPQQKSVRIRYRIDGVLMEAMTVPKNLQAPLLSRLKIMAEMNIAERRVPQDGRIEVRTQGQEYDLRVSTIPTPFGEKCVMRILDKGNAMVGLSKLGFTPENQALIDELISQPNGMFLCTGPTGSGKTTTQYSVLNKLNTVGVNIITVEDPVEYQLNGLAQVQVNKKAGLTFATALRAFLRQDPDIIMVG